MECTTATCSAEATRVLAWPLLYSFSANHCIYVAPYCDEHAADVARGQGGVPAAGPTLSSEAEKIEGIRS